MDTTPSHYPGLLAEIRRRIRQGQARAILAVNQELLALYWDIGCLIDARQKSEGWGAAVIPRLAKDLHNELPEEKGFSERNIKLMVQFYREYPTLFVSETIGQPAVAQLPDSVSPPEKGQPVLAQIPWAHNVLLMQRVKDRGVRLWYAEATLANGWSRNVLQMQIETAAHTRQGKATSNFALRLPPPQSDLVQQALKDPYLFDFLTLEEPFRERELETGLIAHLEKFLLELGQGFAFVGRQYHVDIGDQDFYIDLLFYHLHLRCYIVIELKRGKFKPEYAGKMNFYCSVVDDMLRHESDAPTIGLILCQQQNAVIAEYALRGVDKPIGVSTFDLTRALPTELESSLPSIEQIERELGGDQAGV
ncbi:MAG: PDDEXK nuclease domain-containing protein [Rhodocyclaceae bacterium]|nr:PDDEXK nuclease domain-containing protein [Rhodocyclaceae bacterium]